MVAVVRQAARDVALPVGVAVALIGALVVAGLLAPAGIHTPATAAAGAALLLLAFVRWPKPSKVKALKCWV